MSLNKLVIKVQNLKHGYCSKKKFTKICGIMKMLHKKLCKYKASRIALKKKYCQLRKEVILFLKVGDTTFIKPLLAALIKPSNRRIDVKQFFNLRPPSLILKYVNELKSALGNLIVLRDIAIKNVVDNTTISSVNEKISFPQRLSEEISKIEKLTKNLYYLSHHYDKISIFNSIENSSWQFSEDANKHFEGNSPKQLFKIDIATFSGENNASQLNKHFSQQFFNNNICEDSFKMESELLSRLIKLKLLTEDSRYHHCIENITQKLEDLTIIDLIVVKYIENELFMTEEAKSRYKKHYDKFHVVINETKKEVLLLCKYLIELESVRKDPLEAFKPQPEKKTSRQNSITNDTAAIGYHTDQDVKLCFEKSFSNMETNFENLDSCNSNSAHGSLKASCKDFSLKYSSDSNNHFGHDAETDYEVEFSDFNDGYESLSDDTGNHKSSTSMVFFFKFIIFILYK